MTWLGRLIPLLRTATPVQEPPAPQPVPEQEDNQPQPPTQRLAKLTLDQEADLVEASENGDAVDNPFFKENLLTFNHLHKAGINLEVSASEIIGESAGARFAILGKDDIQVTDEVFIGNEYNVISNRPKLVVDIGMNAGYASLFFAAQPAVIEVHAYEPFSLPFARAQRNFQLNPSLAGKIHAHNFGLGAADEQKTVLIQADHTIGISVEGAKEGEPETIRVKDAGPELAALANTARQQGLELVVKMDCEGSEFPIFEALGRDGLLASIDVLMIEWHKWWSDQASVSDLVGPLAAAGFIVFDRTSAANPHAGMLYAAKRSAA